jgi:type II secretory ATPase GspE/PulE/Tfp pilus assembly ATPase PilB-like protein
MSSFLIVGSTEIDPRSPSRKISPHRPEGILLITGPTGSGKTSTLYAALGGLAQTGQRLPRHRLPWTHRHLRTARDENDISELILTRAADARFYEAARANGMVSLREECLTLVARGETTLASQYT